MTKFLAILMAVAAVMLILFGFLGCAAQPYVETEPTILESTEPSISVAVLEEPAPSTAETELKTEPTTASTEPIENTKFTEPYPAMWVIENSCVNWYSEYRVYATGEPTYTAGGAEIDIEFLAKLLYAEAGGMNWEAQVYTCSAILNFCDRYGKSVWEAGHNADNFAVAPYVDYVQADNIQHEVIDYVLAGGRIAEINHFATWWHDFGTPICEVDGHYFVIY